MRKSKYEKKLDSIMKNLKVSDYHYNWDRYGSWIEFHYKDNLYRLEHSIDKARLQGIIIQYGSEAFAQIVMALEDLNRAINRGVYDLDTWLAGVKLPPKSLKSCRFLEILGFTQQPSSKEEIWEQYDKRIKELELNENGNHLTAKMLKEAAEKAVENLSGSENRKN